MKLRLTAALVVALCTLVGVALAGQVPLVADPSIPAAAGNIDYLHDKNHNIKYHIETKHLARPDSLTPAKNAYVVWIQPRGKDPVNAGVLTVNDQLVGSFRGTTPYQTFDVFVTAEDSPSVDRPSGTQLMKASVQAQP